MTELNLMSYILMGAVGAICAIVANKKIAVFHDGVRPVVPQYLNGQISKAELAAISFAMSFGFIIGFGIALSIGTTIIIIHGILLTSDVVGLSISDKNPIRGTIISGIIGGGLAIFILAAMNLIVGSLELLPINPYDALSALSSPLITVFALAPSYAVAKTFGNKKGVITFSAQIITYLILLAYGTFSFQGSKITLTADGFALMLGVIMMIFFAIKHEKKADTTEPGSNEKLTQMFSANVVRIKTNWKWLFLSGGLIAMATAANILSPEPYVQVLQVSGNFQAAFIGALAAVISFFALVMTTAIITGVYSPAGTKAVNAIGLLCIIIFGVGSILAPIVAFFAGGICIVAEIFILDTFGKTMDKYPGVNKIGDAMRDAMAQVVQFALLVGAMMGAQKIGGGFGFLFIAGVYFINKSSKKPIMEMAVGPIALLILIILLNLLTLIGFWTPLVK